MTPATKLTEADREALREARAKSPAALQARIASLTAENERLREAILLQIAFHEDLSTADLNDMAADAVTVGMLFQASSRNHIVRLKAALQPEEGV